jgi:FAD/FMN-containing dehydrogenase
VDCEDADFAIKGRTHAPAAGFANIEGGITIDMTGLSSVTVNDDHSVAHVGAGASWLDVYTYLDPLDKSVAGGRNGAVGVGGLTLGGGISYFSPQVGFTCDTVVNFEVALADGKLVNANEKSHPDLFRALKGGMNNLGLVTRIDYNTVDISKILGGSIVNDISKRDAVFKAFANIAGAAHYDVHASIVMGLIFNSTSQEWILSSTPIYTLPDPKPKVYEELFAVPSISSTVELVHLHKLANESATPPLNWAFFTGTYGVSAELIGSMFDAVNETIFDFNVPEGVLWSLAFEPLPTTFLAPGAGKNVLGTSPKDGNGMILLISPLWPDSKSNDAVHAKAEKVIAAVNAKARSMGLLKKFVYANYAGWSQHPIESYGGKNVAFLKRTAKKYDPTGVFQRKVPGGFKLP